MVTLANGFAARGHRVDLVLARAEGPYLPEVASAVRVVDLDKGRVLASFLPLARYLRRERPDAMLSALNHANIIAILARKLARVPTRLVVSERNSLSGLSGGGVGLVIRWLMRKLYPSADAVIAVSQGVALELVREFGLSPDHVTAIPNPVDIEALARLAQEHPQHPWFVADAPPVVLAAGRLVPQKDYPALLDAFAKLLAGRDVRLVILGEGPLRAELEVRTSALGLTGSVEFVGFQQNPFGWMAACKVFVLPSRFEGFPNSLVQAMACGARIVATDCPTGPSEILEGGKWGRLVPVGDAEALAFALGEALDEREPPEVRLRAEQFRVERAVASYANVLTS